MPTNKPLLIHNLIPSHPKSEHTGDTQFTLSEAIKNVKMNPIFNLTIKLISSFTHYFPPSMPPPPPLRGIRQQVVTKPPEQDYRPYDWLTINKSPKMSLRNAYMR